MTCLGCTVRCEATVCVSLEVIWFLSTKENFEQLETQMCANLAEDLRQNQELPRSV